MRTRNPGEMSDPDPGQGEKSDPDPDESEKSDPDLLQRDANSQYWLYWLFPPFFHENFKMSTFYL